MSRKALFREFKRFVEQHTPAKTAVWLGHKTTGTLSVWLYREKIPLKREEQVLKMMKERGGGD